MPIYEWHMLLDVPTTKGLEYFQTFGQKKGEKGKEKASEFLQIFL